MPAKHDFFTYIIFFITFVVFGGFAASWVVHPENPGRMAQSTMLHGICSAAWFILLICQLLLVQSGKIAVHRVLGKTSVLAVVAILVTGVLMTMDLYHRLAEFGVFDPADAGGRLRAGGFLGGAFLQWTIFALLYVFGLLNVRQTEHHKRFMLAATIQLMPEALNRLVHLLQLPGYVMLTAIFAIYLCLFAYDWKTAKRIYWSSLVSFVAFVCLATAIYTLFRTQVWGDWIVGLIG